MAKTREEIKKEMESFVGNVDETEAIVLAKPKPEKKPQPKQPKHANYFEGEIQLRNINPAVVEYVLQRIEEEGAMIPAHKEHNIKDVDLQVSSKKLIRKIGAELVKKFGGEISEHERLHSTDKFTSKLIYRLNLLYRKHDYDKGTAVMIEGEPYLVHGFTTNKLKVSSLTSGRNTQIDFTKVQHVIPPKKLQIVQNEPTVCVLDENYQTIVVANPKKDIKVGKKVTGVFFEGKVYLTDQ